MNAPVGCSCAVNPSKWGDRASVVNTGKSFTIVRVKLIHRKIRIASDWYSEGLGFKSQLVLDFFSVD